MLNIKAKTAPLLALLTLAAFTASTQAALLAYDDFSYSPGTSLAGQSGGIGFSGAWSSDSYRTILTPGLSYGDLLVGGNAVTRQATSAVDIAAGRALPFAFGVNGTTLYVSILMRPDGPLNAGYANGYFGVGFYTHSAYNGVFFGKPGSGLDEWVVSNGDGTQNTSSGVATVVGRTDLLVLKARFTAAGDTFTLFVNPTPGGVEPSSGTVFTTQPIGTVSAVDVVGPGAYSFDELRIGSSFGDVVPVPEPASLALLTMGGLMLISRQRRVRT